MSVDQELKRCLAVMARRDPQNWDQFLRAYRAYSDTLTSQLVSSPLEQLQVAQGRARQGIEFMRILDAALKDDQANQKGKTQ